MQALLKIREGFAESTGIEFGISKFKMLLIQRDGFGRQEIKKTQNKNTQEQANGLNNQMSSISSEQEKIYTCAYTSSNIN